MSNSVIFQAPVFYTQPTGEIVQLLSFNGQTSSFNVVNIVTGATSQYGRCLDAEKVSFKPKKLSRVGFDQHVIVFLLTLGVTMIRNIPEWFIENVPSGFTFDLLINRLTEFNNCEECVSVHETEYGPVLFDAELSKLCRSALTTESGNPALTRISTLNDKGFYAHPLKEEFGWEIPAIETRHGLLIYS